MIYFAQLPTGAIKIGTSENVDARLGQLERHYRHPVALLHTIDGGRDIEREMHERFGHLRFGKTEQFRPGPDLMEFIGKPLLVGANPEAVEATESFSSKLVPVRFMMPPKAYEELTRQAERVGLSNSSYAKMLVMKGVAAEKEGGSR